MGFRVFALAATLLAAACAPPASPEPPAAPPAVEVDQAALDALTPVISAEIGAPVALDPSTANVTGEWAYIVAIPKNEDGSAMDWSLTNLASRYENGVMDESGAVYALLRKQDGVWSVAEYVIAPTDVAWLDWAGRHNVPEGIIETPGSAP